MQEVRSSDTDADHAEAKWVPPSFRQGVSLNNGKRVSLAVRERDELDQRSFPSFAAAPFWIRLLFDDRGA